MKSTVAVVILVLGAVAASGCHLIGPPNNLAASNAEGEALQIACVGEPVTFTCHGTDPLSIHLYRWDFGDGAVTEWGGTGEPSATHTYSTAGEYEVRVMERCPLIFGQTCLMRTEWSASLKIVVREPASDARR